MANENPKNELAESVQTKQGSKFQADLDKHGFKLTVTFFIVLVVLCLMPTALVVGDFLPKGCAPNEQYQTILFTTLITLFGILMTGIFIFMTFRIEHGAKIAAREEARNVAEPVVRDATEKIQALEAQVTERLEQAEAAATKRIEALEAQVKETTIEAGERMEEAGQRMKKTGKERPDP